MMRGRKHMDRFEYVSNDEALLKIERYCLQEGKAAGTQMIRICNVAGLEMHLVADRSLDISELRFRGVPISYLSATGITHPSYFEPEGYGWLRSFYGGFLTTCGLNQVGEPCRVGSNSFGLHGRIANCPAEHLCTEVRQEGGKLIGVVKGTIKQACQQGEAYLLRRTYYFTDDSAEFTFEDEIENQSGKAMPLQVLYHFNLGYPFLSPTLKMKLPERTTIAWDEVSEEMCASYSDCVDEREMTLLHMLTKQNSNERLVLYNQGIRLQLEFDGKQLPILAQWRLLQPREYILAFEPTNNHLRGLEWETKNGTGTILEPGEKKKYKFHVELREEKHYEKDN